MNENNKKRDIECEKMRSSEEQLFLFFTFILKLNSFSGAFGRPNIRDKFTACELMLSTCAAYFEREAAMS